MYAFIIAIHLVVSITMILIIIFQSSKGAEMGAVFGGGASQTAFGSAGPQSFLERVTVVCAVVFMLTSLTLAYMSAGRSAKAVKATKPPIEQPLQPPPQQQPPASETPAVPQE